MDNSKSVRKWSEIHNLAVVDTHEGKTLGHVADFYLQKGSNAIYALSVRTRLYGDLTLPATGIKSIEDGRITVINAQMLLKAIPPYVHGHSLLKQKVEGQNERELGTIEDILLGVDPLSALRVTGYEVANGTSRHRVFTADTVAQYRDDAIVIYDQAVKK